MNETRNDFGLVVKSFGIPYFTILILFGTIGNLLSLFAILGFGRSYTKKRHLREDHLSVRSIKPTSIRCESVDSDPRAARTTLKFKRQASWIIFSTLSIADTVTLWINPLRYWLLYVFDYDIRTRLGDYSCRLHTMATYSSRDFATWVLCLLTLERYIQAGFPHKAQFIWSSWRKMLVWFIVIILIITKNSIPMTSLSIIETNGSCLCDTQSNTSIRKTFFVFDIILYSIIPTCLLLYLNMALLRVLRKAKLLRIYGWMNSSRPHPSVKLKKTIDRSNNQANRLLVSVSIFHLVASTPLCVFSIIENEYALKRNEKYKTIIFGVGHLLVMLAYSSNGVNCLIYFLSSKNFRRRLIYLLALDAFHPWRPERNKVQRKTIMNIPK